MDDLKLRQVVTATSVLRHRDVEVDIPILSLSGEQNPVDFDATDNVVSSAKISSWVKSLVCCACFA